MEGEVGEACLGDLGGRVDEVVWFLVVVRCTLYVRICHLEDLT